MVWIATADAHGECDCSFRAGPPGFVQMLDASTVRYPEYRRNGHGLPRQPPREPHVGMVFLDFNQERIGLHLNGTARIVEAHGDNGERALGTDDARAKGGDHFGTSCEPRPWVTDA